MRNRIELTKYFAELGFKVGAEIGVESGKFSETICQNNPGVKLYCVDYWEPYPEFNDYRIRTTLEKLHRGAVECLAPYKCEIIKKFSMDAVKDFADESLDFVYIDANHNYEFVADDIREWTKKVRRGGIVSGHDYIVLPNRKIGVIKAVDEYVKEHNYKLMLTGIGAHKDSSSPSWFFIKQ